MNNKYSSRVTQPRSQGASQAMLYGIGLTDADLQKPQVGICSMWYEGNTCNMHLDRLAAQIKEGVRAAGLVGLRFNTIGVSDGISMGTEGMSYSLPSRDLIADSIETVVARQKTLEDVIRWALAQKPERMVERVVVQDEYTHDVVIPWADGVYLVYDTT